MITSVTTSATVLFLVTAACAHAQHGPRPEKAHDAQTNALDMKAEQANDAVEVVRIHLAPHQKVSMHDVTPRVVVWLTDAHLRATRPDGTTRDERATQGQVEWVPAQRHAAESLDDHPVEFIAVIPKASKHARVP